MRRFWPAADLQCTALPPVVSFRLVSLLSRCLGHLGARGNLPRGAESRTKAAQKPMARFGFFRRKCAQNGPPTHFTPPGRSPCQADQLGEWPNDMNLISLAILRPTDRNSLPRARRREARLGTAAGQKTAWADVQARREMRPFQVVPWTPQAPPGEAGLLAWLQLRCVRSSGWQLSPTNCVELRAARNYHNGRSSW